MAQVQMQVYRGTSDYLDTISNVDGQFLYDEDTHQILVDNGTTREQYGGGNEKVYDTYAEAIADLANIAEGQTVFVKEGSNDDLAQRVDDLETDLGDKATASAVSGADAFAKINTLNTHLTKINGAASVYSGTGIAAYSKARYTLTVTTPTATNTRPVGIREIVSSDGDFIFTPVNIANNGRAITVDGFNCSSNVAYPGTISCNFSYREFN